MRASAQEGIWESWRLALLALVAVLIIVLPSLVLRHLSQSTAQAETWVKHSQEVGALLYRLQADIRDVESAVLTLSNGIESPLLYERMEKSHAIAPTLDELKELVRDNPDQLVRLGHIGSLLEHRTRLAAEIAESQQGPRRQQLIEDMALRYPIRDLVVALQGEEDALFQARASEAQKRQRIASTVSWVAVVIQLLLLCLVLWLLQRQVGRRMSAEKHAVQTSARALSVLQSVREPIVLLDAEQRIVLHNAAFADLYGLEDEVHLQPLHKVANDVWGDLSIRQRLADVLLRGRELWDYELRQPGADGVARTMLINARRMLLPDSEDQVILMTISDVTLQRAVQLRIEELNRQLAGKVEQMAEVNRELEAFSYSVSHDLRAPLRHIAGFSDKLAGRIGEDADEKSRHYLEVIGGSARRMATLIDDLLVYSRLGRGAMRMQMVDMQSLVAETRALLDSTIETEAERGPVDWQIGPLPVIVGDENMMRQVWLNLLGNAVKYTAGTPLARVDVTCRQQPDGSQQFTVRDNGAGFDMTYAGKLFGVFQRLHKASEYPGTGIGLASARRVLLRHGGKIWAEAEPGKGATFHFVLPSAQEALNQGKSA
jgi:PAS domain S-box-containing protein